MTSLNCCLCAQIAGEPSHDLLHAHFGGEYQRRVREIDSDMVIMPSLGALVPGHVLICPQACVRSFAQVARDATGDITAVLEGLVLRLRAVTGREIQLFEHGDAKDSDRVSCSVEHAHIHAVPGVPDLWPVTRELAPWQGIRSIDHIRRVVGDGEYLSFRTLSGQWWVARAPTQGFESQLLRRVVATALLRTQTWDWRKHPALDMTAASWRTVRDVVLS
jgi:diadenosine tetraphosphate (Ap4A) HIT family hydrolase